MSYFGVEQDGFEPPTPNPPDWCASQTAPLLVGAPGRTQTCGRLVRSELLCSLSYKGMELPPGLEPGLAVYETAVLAIVTTEAWCRTPDSNRDEISPTGPSSQRGCRYASPA